MGAAGPVKITVLGSGTSVGVPTPGCDCAVCRSTDPRDNRLRPSVLLQYGGRNVVIDTTPDFRTQVLRARLNRLDAVLFTHSHADHIMGLDDVRSFNFRQRARIPIYASAETMGALERVFQYVFNGGDHQSSVPQLETHTVNGASFNMFGQDFTPVRLMHGKYSIYGYRFGRAAYLTDHSEIPPESMEQLQDLDVLFLDALRHRPHPTHSTVEHSLQTVEKLAPRRAFFTHICHDLPHQETEDTLPEYIRLAYDGLEITVGGGE